MKTPNEVYADRQGMNTLHLITSVLVTSATALPGTWTTTGVLSRYTITAEDRVSLQLT